MMTKVNIKYIIYVNLIFFTSKVFTLLENYVRMPQKYEDYV